MKCVVNYFHCRMITTERLDGSLWISYRCCVISFGGTLLFLGGGGGGVWLTPIPNLLSNLMLCFLSCFFIVKWIIPEWIVVEGLPVFHHVSGRPIVFRTSRGGGGGGIGHMRTTYILYAWIPWITQCNFGLAGWHWSHLNLVKIDVNYINATHRILYWSKLCMSVFICQIWCDNWTRSILCELYTVRAVCTSSIELSCSLHINQGLCRPSIKSPTSNT